MRGQRWGQFAPVPHLRLLPPPSLVLLWVNPSAKGAERREFCTPAVSLGKPLPSISQGTPETQAAAASVCYRDGNSKFYSTIHQWRQSDLREREQVLAKLHRLL